MEWAIDGDGRVGPVLNDIDIPAEALDIIAIVARNGSRRELRGLHHTGARGSTLGAVQLVALGVVEQYRQSGSA